ncbi:MAG: Bug family tripartite tricarboxylate transporter substrate binding protein [bacterium]|jgi:tripartite-type tricarboxylate transporter receptor subunit TctC|nr:tripartite tricarboxylate transporter substrate binding protein [Betaproteobacteria bacterium]
MIKRAAGRSPLAFAAFALLLSVNSLAQSPGQPMRLVVPFPPGGTADLLGRLVAQRLGDALKTTVVIDNRVGAGGSVGAEVVAKAPPDGTTLLLGNASTHAINQWLYKRIGYDPIKDFAPIAQVANVPLIMLVHPSLPVKSAKDLVALARKRPGQMNYASGGAGSTTHLSMELLKTLLKLDIAHIAYRGSGPALSALMAGEIPVMIELMPSALALVKAGKLEALAVTSGKRSALLPDVPTLAETVSPGYEVASWFGVIAPAGTPAATISRLNAEIVKFMATAEVRDRMLTLGAEPATGSPDDFMKFIRAEGARWEKVVQSSGAKAD